MASNKAADVKCVNEPLPEMPTLIFLPPSLTALAISSRLFQPIETFTARTGISTDTWAIGANSS